MNYIETTFGEAEGRPVKRLTLSEQGYRISLLNYGATLQSLVLPNGLDVCLGYDALADYQKRDGCLGATIGRYANRIGGAAFMLNGKEYRLNANEGENQLHGGAHGFDKRVWDYAPVPGGIAFSRVSPEGEEGFPGALAVTVTYTLLRDGICIRYEAESTRDTFVSLTNHAYFNLAGHGNGSVLDHTLALAAEEYTPAGADNLPFGSLRLLRARRLTSARKIRLVRASGMRCLRLCMAMTTISRFRAGGYAARQSFPAHAAAFPWRWIPQWKACSFTRRISFLHAPAREACNTNPIPAYAWKRSAFRMRCIMRRSHPRCCAQACGTTNGRNTGSRLHKRLRLYGAWIAQAGRMCYTFCKR